MATIKLANGITFTGTPQEIADFLKTSGITLGKGKADAGKATKSVELVEFKKKNGEVKMVSKAQAQVWENRRNNGKTKEELAAMQTSAKGSFGEAHKAWMKAYAEKNKGSFPTMTELKEKFPELKGMSKADYKEIRANLRK